jgi:hypothetical protein
MHVIINLYGGESCRKLLFFDALNSILTKVQGKSRNFQTNKFLLFGNTLLSTANISQRSGLLNRIAQHFDVKDISEIGQYSPVKIVKQIAGIENGILVTVQDVMVMLPKVCSFLDWAWPRIFHDYIERPFQCPLPRTALRGTIKTVALPEIPKYTAPQGVLRTFYETYNPYIETVHDINNYLEKIDQNFLTEKHSSHGDLRGHIVPKIDEPDRGFWSAAIIKLKSIPSHISNEVSKFGDFTKKHNHYGLNDELNFGGRRKTKRKTKRKNINIE